MTNPVNIDAITNAGASGTSQNNAWLAPWIKNVTPNAIPRPHRSDNPPCPASTIFAGWRQSVLPVHLLGLAPLLGSIGPVAGDVKLQDDGVVHDPVNRRGGGHGVGEDALPLREDQV